MNRWRRSATQVRRHAARRLGTPAWFCAALALLAIPAAAVASPTVAVNEPCYTPGQQIHVSGQGYTPNGALNLHLDFVASDHTTADVGSAADAQGLLRDLLTAPGLTAPSDIREQVTLTSSDSQLGPPGSPQSMAQTQFLLSRGFVKVPSWGQHRFSLSGKSKITVRGFVGGSTSNLYAHYLHGGKLRKTIKVGKLAGPCGDFDGKIPNVPFKPKVGKYRVRFDTARHYPNRSATAELDYQIKFVRR